MRSRGWAGCHGSVSRQSALGGGAAGARPGDVEPAVLAPARPLRLPRDRVHSRDTAGEGLGGGGGALPQERVLAGASFRDVGELDEQYAQWRDRVALGVGTRPAVHRGGATRRGALAVAGVAAGRLRRIRRTDSRVPIDAYLKLGGAFYRAPTRLVHQRVELRHDRDQVWILHGGVEVARLCAPTSRACGCRRR